jgi:hypothetical protein
MADEGLRAPQLPSVWSRPPSANPDCRQNDECDADATCGKVLELTVPPRNIELANFEDASVGRKGAANGPRPPSRICEHQQQGGYEISPNVLKAASGPGSDHVIAGRPGRCD